MDTAWSHCTYDVGKGMGRSGDLEAGMLEAGRPLILLVASENVQDWGWLLWTSCECLPRQQQPYCLRPAALAISIPLPPSSGQMPAQRGREEPGMSPEKGSTE